MFSTNEGVNDFLSWLEKDSGYSDEKKKTILQELIDWITDVVEAIKELMQTGSLNSVVAEFAKEETARFKEIRQMFLEALDEVADGTVGRETKNTAQGGVRMSFQQNIISRGMSDAQRAQVIKNKKLIIVKSNEVATKNINFPDGKLKVGDAKKILRKIGTEFGVYDKYNNSDFDIEFEFGKNNLNESVNKQKGNYNSYVEMLTCFSSVINNAVGIEVHNRNSEGYKVDKTLQNVYVMLSAFESKGHIIPVKLEVKEFVDKANRLYLAVTLEGIKKDRVVSVGVPNSRSHVRTSPVNISIPDLISKINPKDTDFLKYIPNELLNEEQIKSKEIAEVDEEYRLKVMRGEDVSELLKGKAVEKGYDADFSYRMDHRAPNAKYDTCITEIDHAYGGDGSIYSQYAAHYYGDGRPYDYKAINVIRKARNVPDALITIYRAVPTSVKDTRIRNGDWVTIVKDYAEEHGWRTLDDDYRIIENKVPAKYLYTDGNSIHEFGYDNGNTNEVYKNTENNVKVTEVTYDEGGNLIPLSKRFDDTKSDVKYSLDWVEFDDDWVELAEAEDNYNKAVKNKDIETAQKMVDEVAKKNGYTIKAYHGTKDVFTVFKRGQKNQYDTGYLGSGFYFTDKKESAEEYSSWKKGYKGERVMNVALQMKNPLVIEDTKKPHLIAVQEALGLHLTDFGNYLAAPNKMISDAITEAAQKQGYDGIIRYSDFNDEKTYVVFDSNQIKSTDAITYDDNGNVIPLSERFRDDNRDIRFSLGKENNSKNDLLSRSTKSFRITDPDDYVQVQKRVFSTLVDEDFFSDADTQSRTVKNRDSSMWIEINKKGIKETFNYANYRKLSRAQRGLKLATVRMIPQIIENGKLISDNVGNYHNEKSSVRFAYIKADVQVEGELVTVKIDIKKSTQKNKFWVHSIDIKEKVDKVPSDTSRVLKRGSNLINSVESVSYVDKNVKPSLDWVEDNDDWVELAEAKAEAKSLASKVTELEGIVDELKAKIQHPGVKHILSKVNIQGVARYLKREYMSKINVHVLSDELGTLYGYLANENGLSWDNVQIHLEDIATKILDESKFKNPDVSIRLIPGAFLLIFLPCNYCSFVNIVI